MVHCTNQNIMEELIVVMLVLGIACFDFLNVAHFPK